MERVLTVIMDSISAVGVREKGVGREWERPTLLMRMPISLFSLEEEGRSSITSFRAA